MRPITIVISSLFFWGVLCVSSTSSISRDGEVLMKLKSTLTSEGLSPALFNDWDIDINNSSSHCSFSGVLCDQHSHRVVSLDISSAGLTGIFPSEIANLTSLRDLDISYNHFSGKFPEIVFETCPDLETLVIYHNNFTGQLPIETEVILKLKKLRELDLGANSFTGEIPTSLGRLKNLENLYLDFNRLTGTIPSDLCSSGRLELLVLKDNSLVGSIPEKLAECNSLTAVELSGNFFNGTIPLGLFNLPLIEYIDVSDNNISGKLPEKMSSEFLRAMFLSNNQIIGKIPSAIGSLTNLWTISLEMNRLSGEIPSEIGRLRNLQSLNISSNGITGEIPHSLSLPSALAVIDLSRNRLSGNVPNKILSMTSLTTLNLSYNNLSGRIPQRGQFNFFDENSFIGNPNLCGELLHTPCTSISLPFNPNQHQCPRLKCTMKIIIYTVISLTSVVLVTLVVAAKIKKHFISKNDSSRRNCLPGKLRAFQRLDFTVENVMECLKDENIIGRGGAGIVYHGLMPDGVDVAIKRIVGMGVRGQRSNRGFTAEIETLGRIRHRNIVKLLGYVLNNDMNLLLYEYMTNGSLGELLHGSRGSHFGWESRYKVAVEAAMGLCYLHHDCSPRIIHRDVKSHNILLDSVFEAHLADFGLAKFVMGVPESMSCIAGSYGYIAPEYVYTLRVDEKSDVYSFGVVLLELVTGRRPVGEFGDDILELVKWVRKTASEVCSAQPSDVVLTVVDRRLNEYPLTESVINLFKVAMLCVKQTSSTRPTMREVVLMLTDPPTSLPLILGV